MKKLLPLLLLCGAYSSSHAQSTINVDTLYNGSDFSGQTLTAGASDLGTTVIKFSDVSNTSWSSSPTATPHFSSISNQAFRQTVFDGANWSGLTFTTEAGGSGNQYFYQASFVGADFSGATFNLLSSNNSSQAFRQIDMSGADLSGSYINVGTGGGIFAETTFSGSTNFSGSTIISGSADASSSPSSLGGANFSGATLRIQLNQTDVSGVNFQDVSFIVSDGINSAIRNGIANLTDFRGTDFTGFGFANWLEELSWDSGMAPLYDDNTVFTTQSGTFDPVANGWTYAPIPEPSTATLFAGLLVLGWAARRKRD